MVRAYCSKLGDGAQPPRPLDPAGVNQINTGPLIELFGEARGIIGDDWSREARTSFVLLHERAVQVPVWRTAKPKTEIFHLSHCPVIMKSIASACSSWRGSVEMTSCMMSTVDRGGSCSMLNHLEGLQG